MTPNDFFTPLNGQSLLYPGQSEVYRGQCVQSVLLWLKATGTTPPIYASAYQYFTKGIPGYTQVQRGQPILTGDIIIWGSNFPPSGGNGHIDVADSPGTISSFSAWDSNWIPLVLRRILHNGSNNNYILGYLRKEDMLTPAEVNQLCQIAFNRPAHDDEKSVYSSIPASEALQRILDGAENKSLRTDAQAYRDGQTATATVLKPGTYKVN